MHAATARSSATSCRTVALLRTSRTAVVVRAQQDRRSLLAVLVATAAGAALAAPKDAAAMGLPWQEVTGGLIKGKGSLPKSSTTASSEGYTLEGYPGTRKPSFVEPRKKKALLAKARAAAEQVAKL